MRTAGILIAWASYAIGSWGYVLVKRWDIGFIPWMSPLNPWQWPPAGEPVPPIPADRVFPGRAAASDLAGAGKGLSGGVSGSVSTGLSG